MDGSFACTFMGFFANAFALCTCFWLFVVIYIIYDILQYSGNYKIGTTCHIICWFVPMALTLLPLMNTTYGVEDGTYGWCWLKPKQNSTSWELSFWYLATSYIWIWLIIMSSFVLLFVMRWDVKNRMTATQTKIHNIISKLYCYPMILTFCWILPTVTDSLIAYLDPSALDKFPGIEYMDYISDVMPCSQGLLFAITFWCTNSDARRRIYGRFGLVSEIQQTAKSRELPFYFYLQNIQLMRSSVVNHYSSNLSNQASNKVHPWKPSNNNKETQLVITKTVMVKNAANESHGDIHINHADDLA